MWGISSHPNIVTLVGYSEDPRCIITKVLFYFSFFFIIIEVITLELNLTKK